MTTESHKGIVDLSNRLLRRILERPLVKETTRTLLQQIDPESAPALARTLLWHDPELSFSLVSALPALANATIRFADEVLSQLRQKVTSPFLHDLVQELLREVDQDALSRLRNNYQALHEELAPLWQEVFPPAQDPPPENDGAPLHNTTPPQPTTKTQS